MTNPKAVPRVSIIIPCFNSERYIKSCLESCLSQSYDNLEIIVVDDGSSDSTPSVVDGFARGDARISLIRTDRGGACRARNIGFHSSTGSLVKFLDSDDYLAEGVIPDQVSQSIGGKQIVFGYFVTASEDGRPLRDDAWGANVGTPADFLEILQRAPATASPLFPREAVEAVGGYNEKLIRAQDYEFHVRVAMAGYRFVYSGKPVYFRRTHDSPHRISNRLADDPSEFVEPVLELVANVDEMNNSAYSAAIRKKFAKLFWKIGRRYIREGDTDSAQIMWNAAKRLGVTNFLSGRRIYRLMYRLIGPELTERFHFKTRLRILSSRLFGNRA